MVSLPVLDGRKMNQTTPKSAPKKHSENRQRNSTIHCRVLPEEKKKIEIRAFNSGISISQLLRDAALKLPSRPPRKRPPALADKRFAQLIGQLGKVGNNLNQLTRLSHLEGKVTDHSDLNTTLLDLRVLIACLVEVIE